MDSINVIHSLFTPPKSFSLGDVFIVSNVYTYALHIGREIHDIEGERRTRSEF
jgi:hypothetical protein